MKMKWILPAAGMMMMVSACQPKADVPVPDDPDAKAWNGAIKTAYPEWQPTLEAPQGNPEFEAAFKDKPAPEVKPEAEAVLAAQEQKKPEVVVDEAEKLKYPILYAPIPNKVRLDVTANGNLLVNGTLLPADIVKKYLDAMVRNHGEDTTAIVKAQAQVPAEKVTELLDLCKAAKIAKIALSVSEAPKAAAAAKNTAKSAAKTAKVVRMVVDDSKPAKVHEVKKDETLGSIARKYYKNAAYWPIIYNANKTAVKNPNKLKLKMKLQIPAIKPADGAAK